MQIETRLGQLERSNRRLRAVVVVLVAMQGSVFLLGAIDPNMPAVVRAGKFELIGGADADRVLAEIMVTPRGEGAMVTYGPDGRPLVELRPRADRNGWVTTYNPAGRALVELGATLRGAGAISVSNDAGHRLVSMHATDTGAGAVSVASADGRPVLEIDTDQAGHGRMRTFDGKGQVLAAVESTPDGTGVLATRNGGGYDVARIGADARGYALVGAYDGAGKLLHQWPAGDEGASASFTHVVRARAFEVVDRSQTRVLALVGEDGHGNGAVTTYDASGKPLVELTTDGDGGTVVRHPLSE